MVFAFLSRRGGNGPQSGFVSFVVVSAYSAAPFVVTSDIFSLRRTMCYFPKGITPRHRNTLSDNRPSGYFLIKTSRINIIFIVKGRCGVRVGV